MLQVAAAKTIIDSIGNTIESVDGLITSKEESKIQDNNLAELRNELASIQKDIIGKAADLEIALVEGKAKALQAELTGNKLQRTWRPILMLAFGGIIVYQYFLVHFINGFIGAFGGDFLMPVINFPDRFWNLLEIGIGGYIAGRSLEKISPNIVSTIVGARETKRELDLAKLKYTNKEQRRQYREERRDERIEKREERKDLIESKHIEKASEVEEKKQKKLLRRERGKNRIKSFFKDDNEV